jgi:putative polyhydroxyalkanoate system protein
MRVVRDHGTTTQGAKDAVDKLLPGVLEQFGSSVSDPQGAWDGDTYRFSFQAMGFGIKGTLQVTDTQVVLDAKLPLLARAFEGTIRSNVESELDRLLAA